MALRLDDRVAVRRPRRRGHRPRRGGEPGEKGALAGKGVRGVGEPGARLGIDGTEGGMVDDAGIAAVEDAEIMDEIGKVARRVGRLEEAGGRGPGMGPAALRGHGGTERGPGARGGRAAGRS